MQFIDANVILRFITGDQAEMAARAYRLFESVRDGSTEVTICEAVVAECVHVLSSRINYNLPRSAIREHLMNILALEGLTLPNKPTYYEALDLFVAHNIDFVDALNVAHMNRLGITEILSFDRDFDRVPNITRVEPA
ncbi:MAG: tRNA(fMet)-specific endonuclease VapC [Nitrospira sp.]|nr:tRNA(fMet)-specific endonuclease VapC [Nitrospira sp.]